MFPILICLPSAWGCFVEDVYTNEVQAFIELPIVSTFFHFENSIDIGLAVSRAKSDTWSNEDAYIEWSSEGHLPCSVNGIEVPSSGNDFGLFDYFLESYAVLRLGKSKLYVESNSGNHSTCFFEDNRTHFSYATFYLEFGPNRYPNSVMATGNVHVLDVDFGWHDSRDGEVCTFTEGDVGPAWASLKE